VKKFNRQVPGWSAVALTALLVLGLPTLLEVPASAAPSGSMTVLEPVATTGAWAGLDPATDASSAENYDFLNAIYGELFEFGADGKITPDLATGYKISANGLEVDITLRHGVSFTDGTPFNAAAVVSDLSRDFAKSTDCLCADSFSVVTSVNAVGNYEVALHLSQRDTAIIDAFLATAPNWIGSPTALAKMGETAFAQHPVGAGPFEVVTDTPNSTLALKANPDYWQKGFPKLANLTFSSVASDISGYQAIQSGAAQAYLDLTTVSVLEQAKKSLDVTSVPATGTYAVTLNSKTAPFNNILAREAIYYATDASAIDEHILSGTATLSQSPTGPADLFYSPNVPGYRAYDLTKAKALVKQLGGLSFTISGTSTAANTPIVEAEQSEWAQAGIKATINLETLAQVIQQRSEGSIQALSTYVGSYNPALVPGLSFYFGSDGTGSMTNDETLDGLIAGATTQPNQVKAAAMYKNIFSYLNQRAYAPFLFTSNAFDISSKSVTGITGATPEIEWEDVAS
jgi:peptide/nickel transport system substrate-binding protein